MKFCLFLLTILLVSVSCGKNEFFSEKYWDDSAPEQVEEESATAVNYTVVLTPFTEELSNISGGVELLVNETDFKTRTTLDEFPQSLMYGQGNITHLSCNEVLAANPLPAIVNNTGEFKKLEYSEFGSREALIAQLNQDNPQNGDSVKLDGKSYVLKIYISNTNMPGIETATLIPVACGPIIFKN